MELRDRKTHFTGYIEHNLLTMNPKTNESLLTVRYEDENGIICYKDYATLKKLYEEWEDYTPNDHLIEDVKLRNIIKEWCGYFGIKRVRCCKLNDLSGYYLEDVIFHHSIDIDIENLQTNRYYNIEEL